MKIENGIVKDVNIPGVAVVVDLIPKGRQRRPAIAIVPQYVTIHNTGGANVPADNYRRCQLDPDNDKQVSWHFCIDEKTIVQQLPITEVGWHAGNTDGNYKSFAIEVCERSGAEEVAVQFLGELLKTLGWTTANIRTHQSWSGKQCPGKILPHWSVFIANVERATTNEDKALKEAVHKIAQAININEAAWSCANKINLKNVPALLQKLGGVDKLVKDGVITNHVIWMNGNYTKDNVRSLIIKYERKL